MQTKNGRKRRQLKLLVALEAKHGSHYFGYNAFRLSQELNDAQSVSTTNNSNQTEATPTAGGLTSNQVKDWQEDKQARAARKRKATYHGTKVSEAQVSSTQTGTGGSVPQSGRKHISRGKATNSGNSKENARVARGKRKH
jgi:hypothetical protein